MLDKKLIIKLKNPMTIIAAMKESEISILLSSDTGAMENLNVRLSNFTKLRSHPKANLAWAASGNKSIGIEDFTPWLESYNWPPSDWKVFKNHAIDKLCELNGEQRRLFAKSGATIEDDILADCLIVGWLDRPEIYLLGNNGIAQSYWDIGFEAIGSGANHAWIAYKALEHITTLPKLLELQIIMDVVARSAVGCELPFHIWRITKDSIEKGLEKSE